MISYSCPHLPAFSPDWNDIDCVFAPVPTLELYQGWFPTPEPRFLPATARFGWRDESLFLLATLQDCDIFNAATGFNQETWLLGDVVELFLRPPHRENYFELHVTPENHRLQLHLPNANAIFEAEDWTQFQVQTPLFESYTEIDVPGERWRALLALDLRALVNREIAAGEKWAFSVSRYDWTRGEGKPVLSSTSAHQDRSFHHQHEWGELVLVG